VTVGFVAVSLDSSDILFIRIFLVPVPGPVN